jgi:hypothetical protein
MELPKYSFEKVRRQGVSDSLGTLSIVDGRNPGEFVMEHDEDVAQTDQLPSSPSFEHATPCYQRDG